MRRGKIQRYTFVSYDPYDSRGDCMDPDENGEYVKYSDYKEEVDSLEEELRDAQEKINPSTMYQ
jgi:hypothetical protein